MIVRLLCLYSALVFAAHQQKLPLSPLCVLCTSVCPLLVVINVIIKWYLVICNGFFIMGCSALLLILMIFWDYVLEKLTKVGPVLETLVHT